MIGFALLPVGQFDEQFVRCSSIIIVTIADDARPDLMRVLAPIPDGVSVTAIDGRMSSSSNYLWAPAGALRQPLEKWLPDDPATAYVAAMAPSAMVVLDWT